MCCTIITVAVGVLGRSEDAEPMFVIGREKVELQASAVDGMLQLFSNIRFMGRTVQQVTATAVFVHVMIFECQLAVSACFQVGTESDRLVFKFRQFGITVAVMVVAGTMAVLTEDVHAGFTVVRHQRSVQSRVVIKSRTSSDRRNRMRQFSGIAQWLFSNDIDGPRNGRRAE